MSTIIVGLIADGKIVFGTPAPPFGTSRLSLRNGILCGVASTTDAGHQRFEAFAPPLWPDHFGFSLYIEARWAPALKWFIAASLDEPYDLQILLGWNGRLLVVLLEHQSMMVYQPLVSGVVTTLSGRSEPAYASLAATVGQDVLTRMTAAAVAIEGSFPDGMTILYLTLSHSPWF